MSDIITNSLVLSLFLAVLVCLWLGWLIDHCLDTEHDEEQRDHGTIQPLDNSDIW